MSISKFSLDIKPDIFYNLQVRRLCWPGNIFQIDFSLIFLKHPGSMDWDIIILEKILIVREMSAITGQMLSSKTVLYFSELIFPVIHANVPTPYQQIHPHIITRYFLSCVNGTKSGLYPSPHLRQIYILLLVPVTIRLSSENITLFQFPFTTHLLFSKHQDNRSLLFSALNTTCFWNPCWLKLP